MLEESCGSYAARPALGTRGPSGWEWTTYGELQDLAGRCRAGLSALGVTATDKVAIISHNRLEWVVAAYATYGLGATFVPLYEEQHPAEWEFILADSGAKVVVAGSQNVAETLPRPSKPSAREHVIVVGGSGNDSFERLLERGAASPVRAEHPGADAPASLIYTSGTTGAPKGVMLTHGNIMSNIAAVHDLFDFTEEDRSLAFIPWAHALGHTCELHTMLSLGASIGINDALAHLPRNLLEVQPTILVAVPKIFNRVVTAIRTEIAQRPPVVRKLFEIGVRNAREGNGPRSALGDRFVGWIADALVFSKVRRRFGGKLRYAVSGGAALAMEAAELVQALGITVYEGYGLTEASPLVSVNCPGKVKLGSVGSVIPGVEVKITRQAATGDVDGEIVVYGPNVMKGYHNRPAEQAKVFTSDGGLRTGDLGHLDEDGFLHVTGRIKEQYKLENGKYVTPSRLEEELKLSPYIANVMIYGENKPFNVAVVVADAGALGRWARERGITVERPARDPRVRELIGDEIASRSNAFKHYEHVRQFVLTTDDFTVENELLTPSLKLKRAAVVARYGSELEALYGERVSA